MTIYPLTHRPIPPRAHIVTCPACNGARSTFVPRPMRMDDPLPSNWPRGRLDNLRTEETEEVKCATCQGHGKVWR